MLYRACEGTELGRYIDRSFPNPEDRLQYLFAHVWLNEIPIFAQSIPFGRKRRICDGARYKVSGWGPGGSRITHSEPSMKEDLLVMPNTSNLAYALSWKTAAYIKASIRCIDALHLAADLKQMQPGDGTGWK